MWNGKFNDKTFFFILLIQTRINEQTKQNKTVVNVRSKAVVLLLLIFCYCYSHCGSL